MNDESMVNPEENWGSSNRGAQQAGAKHISGAVDTGQAVSVPLRCDADT